MFPAWLHPAAVGRYPGCRLHAGQPPHSNVHCKVSQVNMRSRPAAVRDTLAVALMQVSLCNQMCHAWCLQSACIWGQLMLETPWRSPSCRPVSTVACPYSYVVSVECRCVLETPWLLGSCRSVSTVLRMLATAMWHASELTQGFPTAAALLRYTVYDLHAQAKHPMQDATFHAPSGGPYQTAPQPHVLPGFPHLLRHGKTC